MIELGVYAVLALLYLIASIMVASYPVEAFHAAAVSGRRKLLITS